MSKVPPAATTVLATCALLFAAPMVAAAPPDHPDPQQQAPDKQQKHQKHPDKKAEKHEGRRADTAAPPKLPSAPQTNPAPQAAKPAPSPTAQAQHEPAKPATGPAQQPAQQPQHAAKPAEPAHPAEAQAPAAAPPKKHDTATATPPATPPATTSHPSATNPPAQQAAPPSSPQSAAQATPPSPGQAPHDQAKPAAPGAITPHSPSAPQHATTANPPATPQHPAAGAAPANPPNSPAGTTTATGPAPSSAATPPTTPQATTTQATMPPATPSQAPPPQATPPSGAPTAANPPAAGPSSTRQAGPSPQQDHQQQRHAERGREGLSGAQTMGIVGLAVAPWIAQALRGQPQQPAQVYVVPGQGPVPPPDYAGPYPERYGSSTSTYTYYGPDTYQPVRNPFTTQYEEVVTDSAGRRVSNPTPRTTHGTGKASQTAAAVPLAPPKEWRYDEVYQQGWSAAHLLRSTVIGPTDRAIGAVENVLVSPDGVAAGLLIDVQPQAGNPTTLSVPWSQVQVLKDGRVKASIDTSRPEQYAMFGANSVLAVPVSGSMPVDQNDRQPRSWTITQLLGDNVMTSDAAGFGVVHDVVFGPDNRIQAVVVHRDLTQGGGGAFAFPFFGQSYGFDPMLPFYALPYTTQQVADMPRFDEGKMD